MGGNEAQVTGCDPEDDLLGSFHFIISIISLLEHDLERRVGINKSEDVSHVNCYQGINIGLLVNSSMRENSPSLKNPLVGNMAEVTP